MTWRRTKKKIEEKETVKAINIIEEGDFPSSTRIKFYIICKIISYMTMENHSLQ
jgi:hypothetical protein